MSGSSLSELYPFLSSERLDLKTAALQHVLGLTGNKEGLEEITEKENQNVLQCLVKTLGKRK